MSFLQSLILGIVQGLTEFLPISSSAHLVLVPYLLNWSIPASQIFPFDVLVQLGTLMAVIIYFWKDLWRIIKAFLIGIIHREPFAAEDARIGWYLVLATIPAGLAGIFLKDRVESVFNDPKITAFFLFITAILLLAAEFFGRRSRQLAKMGWRDALWMGVFQALSIFPGISRSGAAISGGMTRNFDRPAAARFAFLMSIPIMLAAGVFSLPDLADIPDLSSFLPVLIFGFLIAGVVGYLSIHWLLSFLAKRSLLYFAGYCVLLGTAALIIMGTRQSKLQPAIPATNMPTQKYASAPSLQQTTIEETLYIEISPSLNWLRPQISSCARAFPELAVLSDATTSINHDQNTLQLRWGEPPNLNQEAVVIGEDDLVFIVNPRNPLLNLPLVLLRQVVTGQVDNWAEVHLACPECFAALPPDELIDQPVDFLLYPMGDDARAILENAILNDGLMTGASHLLVPDPLETIKEVSSNINALGFLPARSADSTVKVIEINDGVSLLKINRPFLAVSPQTPQGFTAQWLACLQAELAP